MKKLLTAALLASTSICVAQEEPTHMHCFSPKGFYRYHDEENYCFKTAGIGFEYSFHKPKGINFKLTGMTNINSKNVLVEAEQTLFFRCAVNENYNIYPTISFKNSSYHVKKIMEKSIFINKSTGYLGIGWELVFSPRAFLLVEGSFFRDLHNALLVQEYGSFWGRSYSNPCGGKAKIGFSSYWKDSVFLELSGYFAQTFTKCYKECGTEIAFKWGF